MRLKLILIAVVIELLASLAVGVYVLWPRPEQWTPEDITALRSLWLGSLTALPPDPSNAVADDPRAAALGQKLFFDPRFSANGAVSCAICHRPDLLFTDGLPLARGVGVASRHTPTIAGSAYSPWFFWDGRKDSAWSQALASMENPVEHGGNRTQYAHLIWQHYRVEYEALFGPLPVLADRRRFPASAGPVPDHVAASAWATMAPDDRHAVNRVFAGIGKAIAAYERHIMPGPSRFDAYVAALLEGDAAAADTMLSPDERAGLRLFLDRAQCTNCHNGPLFTNNDFHSTAIPPVPTLPDDPGRAEGAKLVREDEFNCLGRYSDASPADCSALRFMVATGPELLGAFRSPTLRNVAATAPYMHAGQFASLREVLVHYNQAPAPSFGHTDLRPLHLSTSDLTRLEAFLHTLNGPIVMTQALAARPPL